MEKKHKKQKNKRNQIVRSSLELFAKKGFHQTRIEDIAERCKVGKGTFYTYFKNKETLIEEEFDLFTGEIFDTLEWVQDNISPDDDLNKVFKEEAKLLADIMKKNKAVAQFLFKEGRSVSPHMNKKILGFYNELMVIAENTYALATHIGLLSGVHPRVAAICIQGGVFQMYNQWIEGQIDDDFEEMVLHTLSFFQRALGMKELPK